MSFSLAIEDTSFDTVSRLFISLRYFSRQLPGTLPDYSCMMAACFSQPRLSAGIFSWPGHDYAS
jgi:hypothetical protein